MSALTDAVGSGDRLEALRAVRDRLARDLDRCEPGQAASLADKLVRVLAEIDTLAPPEQKGTPLDQLAERRRARGAETKGSDAAEGSSGSR